MKRKRTGYMEYAREIALGKQPVIIWGYGNEINTLVGLK